jgi:hypothetical protein
MRGLALSKKRAFRSVTEMFDFFRKAGKVGGEIAAKGMTKAQRAARAKKAAAASAKVRSKNARAKRAAKRRKA